MSQSVPNNTSKENSASHIKTAGPTSTSKTDNKTNKDNSPITWRVGAKIDQYDALITPKGGSGIKGAIWSAHKALPYKFMGLTGYPIEDNSFAGYINAKGYKINGIQLFTLRCGPRLKKLPYVKVTTTPAEIERLGEWCAFEFLLQDLLMPASGYDSRPCRMDIAYDMPVDGSTALWYSERVRRSRLFKAGYGEKTFYLGSKTGNFQAKIYDKKAALWQKRGIKITQDHMTRLELVMRRTHIPHPHADGTLFNDNPLLKIRPYSYSKVITWLKKNGHADLATDVVEDGLNMALKPLPIKERKAIIAALDTFAIPEWWDPKKIWEEMIKEVKDEPMLSVM